MMRNGPAIRILDRVLAVDVVVFRRISDTATRTVMNTASADKKLGKRSWKAQFLALNESQPLLVTASSVRITTSISGAASASAGR